MPVQISPSIFNCSKCFRLKYIALVLCKEVHCYIWKVSESLKLQTIFKYLKEFENKMKTEFEKEEEEKPLCFWAQPNPSLHSAQPSRPAQLHLFQPTKSPRGFSAKRRVISYLRLAKHLGGSPGELGRAMIRAVAPGGLQVPLPPPWRNPSPAVSSSSSPWLSLAP
jgi:hypothetical protein